MTILEVGAGCGDAAIFLQKHYPNALRTYTGLNLNKVENDFASRRVNALIPTEASSSKLHVKEYNMFIADCASPANWSVHLRQHVDTQFGTLAAAREEGHSLSKWLLAIDSLYLMAPSRREILRYANTHLNASLMASDLVIADDASWFESWWLRTLLRLMELPQSNMLTQSEYLALLQESGYSLKGISVLDNTEYCFVPYVEFFKHRLERLDAMGFAWDFTFVYRMGTFMINLCAKTGKLKDLIVVARTG